MYVMGISALYHDAAAALIKDGEIIAAAQEERFTRIKHDREIPQNAIAYCLKEAGITSKQLDAVVYYDNPILTLDRFLHNLQYAGDDTNDLLEISFDSLFKEKLWIHKLIEKEIGGLGGQNKLFVTEHHISHAASAFYPSPYEEAVIITMDGVGEWATTTIGYGKGNRIKILKEINYPHSLGLLYSAFTWFCGFKVNSGDYKLMGLAPYGEPVYYNVIKDNLIKIKKDGSYQLNLNYFDFQYGRAMTNENFAKLFGGARREPEARITKREMDMAASVQKVLEEVVLLTVHHAKYLIGNSTDNLVLAGGVALNCVSNGKIEREKIFKNIWIQPAAGDAGGALGAALFYYYQHCNKERISDEVYDNQKGSYLGPEYTTGEIEEFLNKHKYRYHKLDQEELYVTIAELIDNQNVIGLFEGRMEYGPRALGNRSIIGDARSETMQSILNLKIKYRESFRPFAPSVLEEMADDYFELDCKSPYMLLCADVSQNIRKIFNVDEQLDNTEGDLCSVINSVRSSIPAVTHVDYSARVQTVSEETNPVYYRIIKALKDRTGCGVLINTSFNVRGEPIVCSLEDAYQCFMRTQMDVLVLGNMILYKAEQPKWKENADWRSSYVLD